MSVCAWCAVFVLACPSIASEHSAPGSDAEGVQIDISSRPAYSVAYVRLAAGETVVSEAGAMVAMSAGIEVAASLAGGLVQSVARRLVTNESLVMTRYRGVVPGAWVALAPRFPGDLVSVDMVPSSPLYVQAGSLLAHSEHIEVGASVGSIQTVAMREGVTVLAAVGTGPLIIAAYGGLVSRMPIYASFFMLFTMANVGLPGTSGFVGEILTMAGGFQAATWAAAGAALGVIFSAVYMLTLYRRTVFGEITNPELSDIRDMNLVEWICIAPLAALTILFGIAPNLIFNLTDSSATRILSLMAGGQ